MTSTVEHANRAVAAGLWLRGAQSASAKQRFTVEVKPAVAIQHRGGLLVQVPLPHRMDEFSGSVFSSRRKVYLNRVSLAGVHGLSPYKQRHTRSSVLTVARRAN